MKKDVFFEEVRRTLFGGKLTSGQVEGMEKIIDYRDAKYPKVTDDQLAYILATVKWETAHTMQPIKEGGGEKYLRSKKYYPWYGRGLVQLTWDYNYKKYGITNPDDALEWPGALHVCFDGMTKGKFTGKKLSDYIGNGNASYVGARRIINGTDQAAKIAGIARAFQAALKAAK